MPHRLREVLRPSVHLSIDGQLRAEVDLLDFHDLDVAVVALQGGQQLHRLPVVKANQAPPKLFLILCLRKSHHRVHMPSCLHQKAILSEVAHFSDQLLERGLDALQNAVLRHVGCSVVSLPPSLAHAAVGAALSMHSITTLELCFSQTSELLNGLAVVEERKCIILPRCCGPGVKIKHHIAEGRGLIVHRELHRLGHGIDDFDKDVDCLVVVAAIVAALVAALLVLVAIVAALVAALLVLASVVAALLVLAAVVAALVLALALVLAAIVRTDQVLHHFQHCCIYTAASLR